MLRVNYRKYASDPHQQVTQISDPHPPKNFLDPCMLLDQIHVPSIKHFNVYKQKISSSSRTFFFRFFFNECMSMQSSNKTKTCHFCVCFFQYYLRNIRNLEEEKKCDTAVSKNLFRKKSKLTKRKCDMVSIQYLSMLHVRVELMNGPTHEVYKPTCHGIDIHVRSRVSRSIYKLFYSSLFFNF